MNLFQLLHQPWLGGAKQTDEPLAQAIDNSAYQHKKSQRDNSLASKVEVALSKTMRSLSFGVVARLRQVRTHQAWPKMMALELQMQQLPGNNPIEYPCLLRQHRWH
ncbi:hypothetical protein CA13_51040 [Planctomycetes bacterium CA13]|uniref:Uncharacterized protein n=1 Tax=Novipirellula herctigrandis TaxID=2527986 RepID=A0A5C5Z965_9BACT|nr:hypothetical protein CA13_51040 [Planctomycetes bacterium CA13]